MVDPRGILQNHMAQAELNGKLAATAAALIPPMITQNIFGSLPAEAKEKSLAKSLASTSLPPGLSKTENDIFMFGVATSTEELMTDKQFSA